MKIKGSIIPDIIIKCVGALELKMKTCVKSLQKQTMGATLNVQNSAARNAITTAIEYVTFGFSFRISVFFPF